ncbi:MAG TPA: hypothetical protein PKE05_17920 [Microthrixaceae bacterium]|nr:hypothetical protein [Microthrixaceae bacterium]
MSADVSAAVHFLLRRLVTADTLDADFVEAQVRATCRALGAPYVHPTAA